MSLKKVDRKKISLANVAYLQLREAILSGELKPGEELIEEHLTQQLGISRSPLREALARLEEAGLIESVTYRGTFVGNTTQSGFIHAMQVRLRLEPLAIELAIDSIPDEEIDRVVALTSSLLAPTEQASPMAYFRCDRELHGLAAHHSRNLILERFIATLGEKVHAYRLNESGYKDGPSVASEHLTILEMYRRRDREGAIAAMRAHILGACGRLGLPVELVEKHA